MKKKQSLNFVWSKLLTAKTHFERIKVVEFSLLCCELLSVIMWNFLKRRINTILEKKIKIFCGLMENAPLLEVFLEELCWGSLALLMFTQHKDLKQEGSSYPGEITSSFM